mmetsp:Transcript_69953/g.216271  ORF Transcript_69953/g.216271 Transcript_69953/m.216271 type:complete len:212 (-) Transcript_69953:468-1103(-)
MPMKRAPRSDMLLSPGGSASASPPPPAAWTWPRISMVTTWSPPCCLRRATAAPLPMASLSCLRSARPKSFDFHMKTSSQEVAMNTIEPTRELSFPKTLASLLSIAKRPGTYVRRKLTPPTVFPTATHQTGSRHVLLWPMTASSASPPACAPRQQLRTPSRTPLWSISQTPPTTKHTLPVKPGTVTSRYSASHGRSRIGKTTPRVKIAAPTK